MGITKSESTLLSRMEKYNISEAPFESTSANLSMDQEVKDDLVALANLLIDMYETHYKQRESL